MADPKQHPVQTETKTAPVVTLRPLEARIAELEALTERLTRENDDLRQQIAVRQKLAAEERSARARLPYAKTRVRAGALGTFEPGDPLPMEVADQLCEGDHYVMGVVPGAAFSSD